MVWPTDMFGRRWQLTLGTVQFSDPLACQFNVKRSLTKDPNTLDLSVYNLSPSRRQELANADTLTCRLDVGYEDQGLSTIFLGDVRSVSTESHGPDLVTTFASGDGEKAIRGKRVKVSFGPQVLAGTVLEALADALGVGPGNLAEAKRKLASLGQSTLYPKGITLVGNAWREAQAFARSANLDISIQDGALLILDKGKTRDEIALLLTSDSGLYDSPSVDADGTVTFACGFLTGLTPGCLVQIDSVALKGFYKLTHVDYKGDTSGLEWGATCHGVPRK